MLYSSWFSLASISLFLFAAYALKADSSSIVPYPIDIDLPKRLPATLSQTNLTISGFWKQKISLDFGNSCSIDHDGFVHVYGNKTTVGYAKGVYETTVPYPSAGFSHFEAFEGKQQQQIRSFGYWKLGEPEKQQENAAALGEPENAAALGENAAGLYLSFALLLFVVFGIYFSVKNHKFINIKSNFFKKNGGLLLEQHIASHGSGGPKIFTTEELESTSYRESSRNFSSGASSSTCGAAYRKLPPADCVMNKVFVKEKVLVEEGQIKRFIDEIITLAQVNHQNVIKLLGCCLETEAPILVYELASNGTLFDYIHDQKNGKGAMPHWDILVEIASESAAGLAYLHSQSIIHGNVKSSNIFLTDCLAKVAGFGPPRLVPTNESQINTLMQRTLGYIDPEYFITGQLTNKSDVYSFGVVLVEILTGEKPMSFDRPENQRIIICHFLLFMEQQNGLSQILAPQVKEESKEQVGAVAELAKQCLQFSSAERPTMEEVARELKRLSDAYLRVHVT